MSTPSRRNVHATSILGPDLSARLPETKILLVGAGGIGCELRMSLIYIHIFFSVLCGCSARLLDQSGVLGIHLALIYHGLGIDSFFSIQYPVKNVVMAGFGHITLLDLDTIDLSNLNRQFLFRKKDVKQSKALVSSQCLLPAITAPVHPWDYLDPDINLPYRSLLRRLLPSIQTSTSLPYMAILRSPSSILPGSASLILFSMRSTT